MAGSDTPRPDSPTRSARAEAWWGPVAERVREWAFADHSSDVLVGQALCNGDCKDAPTASEAHEFGLRNRRSDPDGHHARGCACPAQAASDGAKAVNSRTAPTARFLSIQAAP